VSKSKDSVWRFIDLFKGKEKIGSARARRRLEGLCPYPKACYPAAFRVGDNDAGSCCGLIDNVEDLDCIRLCVWHTIVSEDRSRTGEIEALEFFMTPAEAIEMSRNILSGVENAITYNSQYDAHSKHLRELREKSERTGHEQD